MCRYCPSRCKNYNVKVCRPFPKDSREFAFGFVRLWGLGERRPKKGHTMQPLDPRIERIAHSGMWSIFTIDDGFQQFEELADAQAYLAERDAKEAADEATRTEDS